MNISNTNMLNALANRKFCKQILFYRIIQFPPIRDVCSLYLGAFACHICYHYEIIYDSLSFGKIASFIIVFNRLI